ncbi:protein FAM168A-like [Scleropages formosus]|uniref:Protein FAM168A-like n=1 Tax=Scleropages formosus TaxID=113540 RepID=A0A0N8JW96_SCLFO|nr:protein FAM168A-like [Scleropages formosus]
MPGYAGGYAATTPTYTPNLYQSSTPGYPPGKSTLLSVARLSAAARRTLDSFASGVILRITADWGRERAPPLHVPPLCGLERKTLKHIYSSPERSGYASGNPYKVPPAQPNGAPPPYSPCPSPYQAAMYPVRSAYPQQNLYAQGAYYTQPVYAAQPHVIHHTTVVQPNSIPSAIYPAPVSTPRSNGVAMGMVAGATVAMSAGTLLTAPQHPAMGAHPVTVPTYRPQGAPGYGYVPPHW